MQDAAIEIVPYSPEWPERFAIEAEAIEAVLRPWLAGDIEHIGSTSIPGLGAKLVIDIMAPVHGLPESMPAIALLADLKYCYFPYKRDEMHWFCKPSPAHRTHHLHLVPSGGERWRRSLAFRDALRKEPALAARYELLKRDLAHAHPADREAYTEGKAPFIRAVVEAADPRSDRSLSE